MSSRLLLTAVVIFALSLPGAVAQTIADLDSNTFAGVRGLVVPPVARNEVGKLVDAGTIDVSGFAYLTLNLAGETKGPGKGEVGAILIPDVPPYDIAYQQLGLVPVSIEISAVLPTGPSPYFMAKQKKVEIGFPRYRVLLYNTSQTTVTVALFGHKTVN